MTFPWLLFLLQQLEVFFSGYFSTAFLFAPYKRIKFLQFQVSNQILRMFKRSTAFFLAGQTWAIMRICKFAWAFKWNYKYCMRFHSKSMSLENWTLRFTRLKVLKYNLFWFNSSKIKWKKYYWFWSYWVSSASEQLFTWLEEKKKKNSLWRKLGKPF